MRWQDLPYGGRVVAGMFVLEVYVVPGGVVAHWRLGERWCRVEPVAEA